MENSRRFLEVLNMELLYYPAILLLGIFKRTGSRVLKRQLDTCDIIGNIYLLFVSGFWHRASKALGNFVSRKVSFVY